jgi:hypothetical protein
MENTRRCRELAPWPHVYKAQSSTANGVTKPLSGSKVNLIVFQRCKHTDYLLFASTGQLAAGATKAWTRIRSRLCQDLAATSEASSLPRSLR